MYIYIYIFYLLTLVSTTCRARPLGKNDTSRTPLTCRATRARQNASRATSAQDAQGRARTPRNSEHESRNVLERSGHSCARHIESRLTACTERVYISVYPYLVITKLMDYYIRMVLLVWGKVKLGRWGWVWEGSIEGLRGGYGPCGAP